MCDSILNDADQLDEEHMDQFQEKCKSQAQNQVVLRVYDPSETVLKFQYNITQPWYPLNTRNITNSKKLG